MHVYISAYSYIIICIYIYICTYYVLLRARGWGLNRPEAEAELAGEDALRRLIAKTLEDALRRHIAKPHWAPKTHLQAKTHCEAESGGKDASRNDLGGQMHCEARVRR